MTAPDLLRLGAVDSIVEEPAGGAQQDPDGAAALVGAAVATALRELEGMSADELVDDRYRRFRKIGAFVA
jgi:acetyl-CoA carboxylase carboxyl transferase subunit alpha